MGLNISVRTEEITKARGIVWGSISSPTRAAQQRTRQHPATGSPMPSPARWDAGTGRRGGLPAAAQRASAAAHPGAVEDRLRFLILRPQQHPNSSKIFSMLSYLLQWHLLATARAKADFLLLG